jgi:large subunit ribosomal protein L5
LQTAIEALERGLERQVPGIKEKYTEEVVPALMKKFEYKSPMQVPKLEKIVVNVGMGEAIQNGKAIDAAINDIRTITGQQPVINRAKKSVAAFKLREGMQIGIKVTLRGSRMYDFFDRLIGVALPRVRDFRGISAKSFDGRGNYTMGIKEQLIFPEINYDKIDKVRGMDITFVTTAKTDEEAREFLKLMGVPFQAH